ncbi:MAG: phosphodiesterase YaeI [Gemmatales bacterium]|nr:phosphodiesterase YaeI [Gemmatales bacterium]MDW8387071.1 phosphodiesterase YaeI [Gemmatales bacterium]
MPQNWWPEKQLRSYRFARWLGRNWARISYGRKVEPTWLELTRHEICLQDLPSAFHGFRIAHLTDLHAGRSVPGWHLERAVELAASECPDLIALTGDFVHAGKRYVPLIVRTLSRLKAAHGVFAVLGNHDFAVRTALGFRLNRHLPRYVEDALREAGIVVLRNRSLTVTTGGHSLRLVGVDDLWSGACDLDLAFHEAKDHEPTILLAHNPRVAEHLNGRRCDLMLSGHTHGGQINWPGYGRFLLGRRSQHLAAGLCRHRGTWVYVNRGVGHGFRFRFGARPEVAILRLQASP